MQKTKFSSNNRNNFSFNKNVIDLTRDNFNFFENMKQHWCNIKKLSETKRQQSNIDSRAIDTNNNKVSSSSRAQRQREEMEWDSHREPLKHIYILLRSTNSLDKGGTSQSGEKLTFLYSFVQLWKWQNLPSSSSVKNKKGLNRK